MKLRWEPVFNDLIILFAGLYSDPANARFAVRRAGLNPDEIDFTGAPKIFWFRIIEEANKHDKIEAFIHIAKENFPNIDFEAFERQMRQPILGGIPSPSNYAWKGQARDMAGLEKIMGAQPTFLPISFLEVGLLRAKSVVRISTGLTSGTGFLTSSNLLVTNNHVIPSPEDAQKSEVWFNYETNVGGGDASATRYMLNPDKAFATDKGDDWTAVYVEGNPNAEWGQIYLHEVDISVDDYVNIIQHPAGLPKQIALYHNVVVFSNDSRVQYLTDTMPGSSGAPVFDSDWRFVALHHSGGWIPEPGGVRVFLRNEGIHVRALLSGLKKHNLLST
ncbi:MAG TPA: serine protease [Chloroflexia bacterium]|jgi:hypothetical protein